MIDFILAGLVYLLVMFLTFSFLSFVTIGSVYSIAAGLKRFVRMCRHSELILE